MLTADLVRVRKKGTELTVSELPPKLYKRALELAEAFISLAEASVGATRADLEEAFATVQVAASEHKLALGLRKLVEDRIEFEVSAELPPEQLRRELFTLAAQERKALEHGEAWDRARFLEREAAARSLSVEVLMRTLYADLRAAQVLLAMRASAAEELVRSYDLAQKQAVLLRAVDVIADVRCRDAYAYRVLFQKLKFFRLLHRIEPRVDGGYRIFIDGPFNLFSASTKYGLSLALALPSLLACDEHRIAATLRWGKERAPCTFELSGKAQHRQASDAPRLPDEVEAFLERFVALRSDWDVSPSSDILELPGIGLCVPDLRFVQRETGELAYLEVLGFWSRAAVWRRVELANLGLKERVLFAVSSRLRVSEEVLGDDVPAQLYVYKGALSAKEVLRRLDSAEVGPAAKAGGSPSKRRERSESNTLTLPLREEEG